ITKDFIVKDTTKPVITLKGDITITISRESEYIDLGAKVIDNYDNDLVAIVNTTNLNVNKVGTYIITYNAIDKNGNKAEEVQRTVIVERNDFDKTLLKIVATITKTEFKHGENLSTLIVTAYDNDGTTYDITNNIETKNNFNSETLGSKELKVTYKDKESIVLYKVVRNDWDKTIKTLTAVLEKDIYKRLEPMSNIVVTRIDNDNTATILKLGEYKISKFNSQTVTTSPRSIVITYDGLTAIDSYIVERNDFDKTLLKIVATITKTEFKHGENLSTLIVTAYDNDGTTYDITNNIETKNNFNSDILGSKELKVTYKDKESIVLYTVVKNDWDKELNRIEATLAKAEFQRDEELSTLTVMAFNNDGTYYDVTALTTNDFNSTTIGDKKLKVTYLNKETELSYKIVRNELDKKLIEVRLSTIPNAQLLFQVNSNPSINEHIIVTKIYYDNTEEITTVYSVNNFTT
ncbi:MAG: DUF5011 domain-containing protein, partial [Bacilli bacterium]